MKITITHSNIDYVFDPDSNEIPCIGDGVKQSYHEGHKLIYGFSLMGLHKGPPILIEMVEPNYETEDGSTAYVWDSLRWADDHTKLEDEPTEYYTDTLREILKEIINETWD